MEKSSLKDSKEFKDFDIGPNEDSTSGLKLDFVGALIVEDKVVDLDDYRKHKKLINTQSLYPATSKLLSKSFHLLKDASEKAEEARTALRNNDIIGSDDAILHITSILNELFHCRRIGDGFGAIVNALFHSLSNRDHGVALTDPQISQILRTVRLLNVEPFLKFERAIDEIILIEDQGFDVDPEYLPDVMDLING